MAVELDYYKKSEIDALNIPTLANNVASLEDDVENHKSRIDVNETDISNLKTDVESLTSDLAKKEVKLTKHHFFYVGTQPSTDILIVLSFDILTKLDPTAYKFDTLESILTYITTLNGRPISATGFYGDITSPILGINQKGQIVYWKNTTSGLGYLEASIWVKMTIETSDWWYGGLGIN